MNKISKMSIFQEQINYSHFLPLTIQTKRAEFTFFDKESDKNVYSLVWRACIKAALFLEELQSAVPSVVYMDSATGYFLGSPLGTPMHRHSRSQLQPQM